MDLFSNSFICDRRGKNAVSSDVVAAVAQKQRQRRERCEWQTFKSAGCYYLYGFGISRLSVEIREPCRQSLYIEISCVISRSMNPNGLLGLSKSKARILHLSYGPTRRNTMFPISSSRDFIQVYSSTTFREAVKSSNTIQCTNKARL